MRCHSIGELFFIQRCDLRYTGALYLFILISLTRKKGHLWLKQLKPPWSFGVLNETSEHESRVALTPDIVTRLRKSGVNCLIESGAGVASHYVDEDYSKAGAQGRLRR